jgi:hypothetical protein
VDFLHQGPFVAGRGPVEPVSVDVLLEAKFFSFHQDKCQNNAKIGSSEETQVQISFFKMLFFFFKFIYGFLLKVPILDILDMPLCMQVLCYMMHRLQHRKEDLEHKKGAVDEGS